MPIYKIICEQIGRMSRSCTFDVEADTLEQALEKAENDDWPDGEWKSEEFDVQNWLYRPAHIQPDPADAPLVVRQALARLDGRFDDEALMAFGPLSHDMVADIRFILQQYKPETA